MKIKVWLKFSLLPIFLVFICSQLASTADFPEFGEFKDIEPKDAKYYYGSDAGVFKFMLEQFTIDDSLMDQVKFYYNSCDDEGIKAYIIFFMPKALEKGAKPEKVLDLVTQGLFEGVYNRRSDNPLNDANCWRVRYIAAEAMAKIADKVENKKKVCDSLIASMLFDTEERVRGASALSLSVAVKNIANEGDYCKYYYINKMNDRLAHTPFSDQFFLCCLVRAIGELKDKSSFWYLMEERRKAHTDIVQKQIFIAMKNIAAGGGTDSAGK